MNDAIIKTLTALPKDALVQMLVDALTQEAAVKAVSTPKAAKAATSNLAPCGSMLTISGNACKAKTKGGVDCGKHADTLAEVEAKRAANEAFVAKRAEYAKKAAATPEDKAATKNENKTLAAMLRDAGLPANGEAWGIAKGHMASGKSPERAVALVKADLG